MTKEYNHFGILFNEKKTSKYMTKDNFVNRNLEKNKYLTGFARNNALENYDLNIEYFNSLNKCEFESALHDILNSYSFVEIFDLNKVKGLKGIYLLILDNYKQIYVGQTNRDLKARILRHFKIEIPFQRVPFVKYDTLPIDAFKPLDTTRIYILLTSEQKLMDEIESKIIKK